MDPEFKPHGALDVTEGRAQPKYEKLVMRGGRFYLEGRKDEAGAALPTRLVEELALIGPREKIRDDLEAWRESIATTLLVAGSPEMLRDAAELVLG